MTYDSKKVEIIITDQKSKVKALKLLRSFSSQSLSVLSKQFKASEPIYTVGLLPKQFFSGVTFVYY